MSCRTGFPNCTNEHFKLLLAAEMPKLTPSKWQKTQRDIFNLIAKHICLDATKDILDIFWAQRRKEEKLRTTVDDAEQLRRTWKFSEALLEEEDIACDKQVMQSLAIALRHSLRRTVAVHQ